MGYMTCHCDYLDGSRVHVKPNFEICTLIVVDQEQKGFYIRFQSDSGCSRRQFIKSATFIAQRCMIEKCTIKIENTFIKMYRTFPKQTIEPFQNKHSATSGASVDVTLTGSMYIIQTL